MHEGDSSASSVSAPFRTLRWNLSYCVSQDLKLSRFLLLLPDEVVVEDDESPPEDVVVVEPEVEELLELEPCMFRWLTPVWQTLQFQIQ